MSFLPGMFPGGAIAARAPLTTLSQVASASSTAASVTGPAGIIAGDLLVLYDVAGDKSTPTAVVPSDFSIISNALDSSGLIRLISSRKIATGAEASASLTGMSGNTQQKLLYVFRGDAPITAVTVQDVSQQSTTGNPTPQVKSSGGGVVPLVVLGTYFSAGGGNIVNPRLFTPAKDGEINESSAHDIWLAYKIYNSSPADTTVDMDDEGTNALASFWLECA